MLLGSAGRALGPGSHHLSLFLSKVGAALSSGRMAALGFCELPSQQASSA